MGFGILFVSYLITFFMSFVKYGFVIRLAGYALITIALIKIYEYGKEFIYPLIVSGMLFLYGIYDFVYNGAELFAYDLPDFFDKSANTLEWVGFALVVIFNLALMYSVYSICRRLELDRQKNAATRNAVIIGAYAVMNIIFMGPLRGNEKYSSFFALPVLILQFAWIILISILIFSCYMYICPEEDVDMHRRKTNIQFIDRMLEESDKRMDEAAKSTQEYYKKKQQDKIDKLNRKKK